MRYLNWKDKFHMHSYAHKTKIASALDTTFHGLPQPPNLIDIFVYAFS
jgi:hypothetical protein